MMAGAIEVFMQNVETLKKYNDSTAESFCASYEEALFDELDSEFFDEESKFDGFLIKYIRQNEDKFGD
jgi:hypothetical protein